ncbi:MAG: 50S ribosomal protein L13 [Candidatus Methanomethylicota archaeon]|uniref:Large ribosomal subunit protein uL13 n=1 Tax=Thermoproteota archaeon TaxID=2056631 RepID=A0A497EV50_9CREN|nr:MAG: 50S ribosomal protein L13 [Candidatus Verstraetearchaeota archaeon]
MTVIDAENSIAGRLASIVAKRLLEGERIIIVNAEKAVISGNRKSVINEFKSMLEIKTLRNPKRGPKRSRRPDKILKDIVWGMLPKHNYRGRSAFKRLKVYIGFPDEFKKFKVEKIAEADISRLKGKYVYLGDVAKEIGWRGL